MEIPQAGSRLTTTLGILGTVLGLIGTGVGIWSQIEARRQQSVIDALKVEVERAAAERENRKLDYEIALKVYDKVTSIDQADSRELRLAVALIEVLPDAGFKSRLAAALAALSAGEASATDDQALKTAARRVAETAEFIAQSYTVAAAANLPATAVEPTAAQRTDGWDFDVFWCEAGNSTGNAFEQEAQAIAQALGSESAGRIRVRMLPDTVNARPGYQIRGAVIRADAKPEEMAKVRSLKERIDSPRRDFRIETSGQSTPWYISIFVCPDRAP